MGAGSFTVKFFRISVLANMILAELTAKDQPLAPLSSIFSMSYVKPDRN